MAQLLPDICPITNQGKLNSWISELPCQAMKVKGQMSRNTLNKPIKV